MIPDNTSTQRSVYPIPTAALESSFLPSAALSPALRDPRIEPFAARNSLRSPRTSSALLVLQKCLGITLAMSAWLVFLVGLAHLVLAAVHNQQGELGMGLDSTVRGTKYCLAGFALAAAGLPQWVIGARKLHTRRLALN